jgi:hypothetical protein
MKDCTPREFGKTPSRILFAVDTCNWNTFNQIFSVLALHPIYGLVSNWCTATNTANP